MRNEFLPFHKPLIGDEEINEVVDTLKSGWLTRGPKTQQFEEEFARYIGCKHAIGVNSCTAGLHLALVAAGIGEGDEIITSPFTFCSTVNVIIHTGATPVFVDIDRNTLNINPEEIEKKITPRTKAIIPVHFAGQPCEMDAILDIANIYGLMVIEDAAHAVGAKYGNKMVGNLGEATSFSFYATKNMTTGEGGMVTTNNDEVAEKIRILSLHGISKDAWKRYTAEGSWYYEVLEPGFKYNMTDIQAALGIHQLRKVDEWTKIRDRYATYYNEAFAGIDSISLPKSITGITHAWHLYGLMLNDNSPLNRDEFIAKMGKRNIGTSVHFIPVHMHPYYRKHFGYNEGLCPVAEDVYRRIVSLPLYPGMRAQDLEYVVKNVISLLG